MKATKTTNFLATLPPPQSELAEQTLKDPYIFDFLTLEKDAQERDLERGLLERIRDFLLELGSGFACGWSIRTGQSVPYRSRRPGLLH